MAGRKQIWQHPWSYIESYLIALGLLLAGFLIEFSTGAGTIEIPAWPGNGIILFICIGLLLLVHFFFRRMHFVKWLSSVPAAISAISAFAFLVMLMAVFPQESQVGRTTSPFGFDHIVQSWPYMLVMLYFLSSLGLVTLKRFFPFTRRNLGFFINHAGLWIAIVAGSLGTSDMLRLTLTLQEGQANWLATDASGLEHELPFAIKLLDFSLEEYEAKIGILDNPKAELFMDENNHPFYASKGNTGNLLGRDVKVLDYLPTAGKVSDRYEPFLGFGAPPAAWVEIINQKNQESKIAWLSCGNFMHQPDYVKLDSNFSLIMIPPEPKRYRSEVFILSEEKGDTISIEVNKPYQVAGWKIYQLSYNERMGRYSETSVFELVRDPWLPLVYIGIFMMMAGAFYLLFTGKRREL
ncbi:MAG: cytochrome c biogenesis protein ResB [Bacteroidales bacterium]|nr:cytochrome c biogenesis protein ResB [Bacteroidales bacterium]